jgi:hypothetical protein
MAKEGNYADADKLQSQVIEIKTRVLGPTHTSTLQSMKWKRWASIARDVMSTRRKSFAT